MKRSLLLVALGACTPSRDAGPDKPFDEETTFAATPAACVYQRYEAVNQVARIGVMSQCLDLPITGSGLVSLVYSDFLEPNRGRYYLGGIAGSTLEREGEAVTLVTGPHRTRYVPVNGRHVDENGADGTWFEVGGSSAIYVAGGQRVTFAAFPDGKLRAVQLVVVGGATGEQPISTTIIERAPTGEPVVIRDDFGRGVALGYNGTQLVSLRDLETARTATVQWDGEWVASVSAPGTTGAPMTTAFSYAGNRLVGMTLPETGRIAWDRPRGFQITKTRFINPGDATTFAVTSLGCRAIDGSRIAGLVGLPYSSTTVPSIYRTEHLLANDGITARPTKRMTDPLQRFQEMQYDGQNRLTLVYDEHGTGWAFAYAGNTQRVVQQRASATAISVFDATLAADAPGSPRLLYATTAGLDRIPTSYSYDGAGRAIAETSAGRTLRRSFTDLGNGTRSCEQYDGSAVTRCTDTDAHGAVTAIFESGIQIAGAQYANGRIVSTTNTLGQQTTLTYSLDQVTRIDRTDGRPAETFAYAPNGALQAQESGPTGRDFTSSNAGRLDGWRDRVASATWNSAISRSADLLTESYFINGHEQWTEQSVAAPPPPELTCDVVIKEGK